MRIPDNFTETDFYDRSEPQSRENECAGCGGMLSRLVWADYDDDTVHELTEGDQVTPLTVCLECHGNEGVIT
jgi:hypothetical protein